MIRTFSLDARNPRAHARLPWPIPVSTQQLRTGTGCCCIHGVTDFKERIMQNRQPAEGPNAEREALDTKPRSKPSGTHYVEPSPLGIEPVEQTEVAAQTNPRRSSERPEQTSEVPLGTGTHAEPPGGGGRESQGKK
jgi:hypothetical protein